MKSSGGEACKPDKAEAGTAAPADSGDDGAASTDTASSPQPAVLADATAIAVAIAAPVIATAVVAAPQSSAAASEPLAMAAAAIAISKSPLEAVNLGPPATPASPASATDTSATAAPAPAALAPGTDSAPADLVTTTAAQPVATDAVAAPTAAPAEQATRAAALPDAIPVAAAIPAAAVAPKAAAKTPAAKIATTAPGEHASDDADAVPAQPAGAGAKTLVAQAPAVDGNQKTGANAVEPATPELPKVDAPTASHQRHAAIQLQADTIDPGQPAAAVQQPAPSPAAAAPVPQLSVTASSSAAVPLNGLALQIAVTAQSGRSRFEIRLDPAELGRIDVRIDVDRHGQMTSHLTVEKPETLAMLRQDAPQLQRALDNAGFKTGDNGLQFSLRDQSSGQNGGHQGPRNAQRLIISEDDGVAAAIAGRSYGRLSGSGGGVDIRV